MDPERREAMNKFIRKFDNSRIRTESEEDHMSFLIQGKRSALNSPFDLEKSENLKETKESV